MTTLSRRHFGALSALGALGFLAACGKAEADPSAPDGNTITVEDNNGSHTISLPLTSVVATDNRTFETLDAWGIKLTAAAVALMPGTVGYKSDESIIDLGNHGEPDLEAVVAAEPQVIVNGQRFAQFHEDFVKLAPEAAVLELDPRDGEPFDAELRRQVTVLGEVFSKQAEAKALVAEFDAAIERAKSAYPAGEKVMAVITSGGEIGYSAPGHGRTFGPIFDILGLEPALEVEDSGEGHTGDDISVEAIAKSNPSWMMIMDRDAAVAADDPGYQQAAEVIESSEALAKVTAVRERNLVYMPVDTYLNEGIQTYTEFFNALADAFEGKA